jgi:hypothetical protein
MTDGHKHREIKVKRIRVVHGLRRPIPFTHTFNVDRVDRSKYPYSTCPRWVLFSEECFYLTWLGFLHRWTGLALRWDD